MNPAAVLRALGPIDAKSVGRDAMLRWLVALPILIALLLRWGTPWVAARLAERYGLELAPYTPLIASFVVTTVPMMTGFVIGFLLLDQRDDQTLSALQVTPLTVSGFLVYRLTVPVLVSVLTTVIALHLTGLVRSGPLQVLAAAVTAAPLAPFFALLLAGFAANKVQGFALMKAAGVLNWPPIVAYFVPLPWQWLFAAVPTYWPAKLFWMLEAAEGGAWVYLVFGLLYQGLLTLLLLQRFNRVMLR